MKRLLPLLAVLVACASSPRPHASKCWPEAERYAAAKAKAQKATEKAQRLESESPRSMEAQWAVNEMEHAISEQFRAEEALEECHAHE